VVETLCILTLENENLTKETVQTFTSRFAESTQKVWNKLLGRESSQKVFLLTLGKPLSQSERRTHVRSGFQLVNV